MEALAAPRVFVWGVGEECVSRLNDGTLRFDDSECVCDDACPLRGIADDIDMVRRGAGRNGFLCFTGVGKAGGRDVRGVEIVGDAGADEKWSEGETGSISSSVAVICVGVPGRESMES